MGARAPIPRWKFGPRWLVLAAYALAAALPPRCLDTFPTLCPFRRLTGLPCAGCGGTHAFVAMAHGQPYVALSYNPLAVAVFALGAAWLILDFSGLTPRVSAHAAARLAAMCLGISLAFGAWRIFSLLHAAVR